MNALDTEEKLVDAWQEHKRLYDIFQDIISPCALFCLHLLPHDIS